MSPKRIYAIFIRQLYLIKSNPTRLASIFFWLIIDIIQWGFISKYLGSLGQSTFGFITVILGAIILWEFVTRIQQGIMTAFLEDIWTRNFINFFSSPLKISEYLSGMVLSGIITSVVGFLGLALIAGLGFGYNIFKIGLLLAPFMLILFIFGTAMGILVASIIFRLGPSAEWLAWPIPLVLSIFCGVFYPLSTLPAAMRLVAKLIPASYVFESARAIINGGNSSGIASALAFSAVLSLIYLFVAYKIFIMVYRRNLKNGAIAKFAAEY